MAKTKTRLHQQSRQLETEFMSDSSEIIHSFEDGWTIRKLLTYADAVREGKLMNSCLCPKDDQEHATDAWKMHPQARWFIWERGTKNKTEVTDKDEYVGDVNAFPVLGELNKLDLTLEYPTWTISLRDPENVPHATSNHTGELGRNNSDLKPEYQQRLDEYWKQIRV